MRGWSVSEPAGRGEIFLLATGSRFGVPFRVADVVPFLVVPDPASGVRDPGDGVADLGPGLPGWGGGGGGRGI